MTRDEAKEILQAVKFLLPTEEYSERVEEALDMAIKALEQPIPKPHDRLMFWETARRIIDSPRSKEQMLAVLDSVPPVEALERKYGKWIDQVVEDELLAQKCSVCGYLEYVYGRPNYCSNCGSYMRERRE